MTQDPSRQPCATAEANFRSIECVDNGAQKSTHLARHGQAWRELPLSSTAAESINETPFSQRGSALQGQCRLYFDSLGKEACLHEKDAHWRDMRQGQIMRNIRFWSWNLAGFVMVGSGVCLEVCKCTLSRDLFFSASVLHLVLSLLS